MWWPFMQGQRPNGLTNDLRFGGFASRPRRPCALRPAQETGWWSDRSTSASFRALLSCLARTVPHEVSKERAGEGEGGSQDCGGGSADGPTVLGSVTTGIVRFRSNGGAAACDGGSQGWMEEKASSWRMISIKDQKSMDRDTIPPSSLVGTTEEGRSSALGEGECSHTLSCC